MICISISQESRRLALADMLNASRQCDLLEIRLDRFGKAPEIGELLRRKPKPVIMSCRRPQDGGQWEGTEEERLAILRQCIIAKADYAEIELDVADQVRPFPPCKRVISYTNLGETPADIAEVYKEVQSKRPDVIKLTTLARTPEEAWPLVQILATATVPTVVVGLGKPGVMLAVLGKKLGAPWTYAALERGMEAYPSQPTVHDLETVYHYKALERGTRLVGVSGFTDREYVGTAALNGLFAHFGLPARCLPVGVGSARLFRKVIDAAKLVGVVVDAEHQGALMEIATEAEPGARLANAADLLLRKGDKWSACNTLVRAAVAALENLLRVRYPGDMPLQGRMVAIVGVNALARTVAQGVKQRGGSPIIVSHDKAGAQELAKKLECRFVLFEALYSTIHEVLVVCDQEKQHTATGGSNAVHPGYLKAGMTVMDLTATLSPSPLLREARARRCAVVTPRKMLFDQLALQARLLTSKEVTRELVEQVLPGFLQEDEEEE
jgi:3-dehydroquinate dehydratase/shikimate dehydrogenase